MKTNIKFLLLLSALCSFTFLKAQDCSHLVFTKGATFEMESYDNKDKKTGRIKNTVKEVTSNGAKKEAAIHTESYDKKDEKQTEGDIKIICDGGKLLIDMSGFARNSAMANSKDMEIKMEASFIEVPAKLTVGQSLPDGNVTMKVVDKKSGEIFGTLKINIINRKVEGKETVTTPAGTFECYKITYEIKSQMSLAMGMNMPASNSKGTEYISKDNGLTVKIQSYSHIGELMGYEILTKYSK
jgi:hypothetical protein